MCKWKDALSAFVVVAGLAVILASACVARYIDRAYPEPACTCPEKK